MHDMAESLLHAEDLGLLAKPLTYTRSIRGYIGITYLSNML